jgi:hypothetical protein
VFGGRVPRFDFEEVNLKYNFDGGRAYTIEGIAGIWGELNCSGNGKFELLRVNQDGYNVENYSKSEMLKAPERFMISMYAVSWAYTNWPKKKVQEVVDKMIKEARDDADEQKQHGEKKVQSQGSFDIGAHIDMTYWLAPDSQTYELDVSTARTEAEKN